MRTQLRRHAERGRYDEATVNTIVDEGLVCHLAVIAEHGPVVLPTAHVRVGRFLYVHGGRSNHLLRRAIGSRACVTVTLVDGLVLAKSAMMHSMNFRSVVVFGEGFEVTDQGEKAQILDAFMEHVMPGRLGSIRAPSPEELLGTLVVGIPLDEASAKVREGGPSETALDRDIAGWAGVVPLVLRAKVPTEEHLPVHVLEFIAKRAS